jgi:hypothetical protein
MSMPTPYRYRRSDDLCIVTCYYNPQGYRSKLDNYLFFEKTLRESGLHWLTLECCFGAQDYELPNGPNIIRVRGRDVMWQKERLLNHAIKMVPARFQKIAWLDCDVLFHNDNWAAETAQLLELYPVLQLFQAVVRLPRGALCDTGYGERWSSFAAVHRRDPNLLLTGDFARHGHTGFAWAARREWLDLASLYDGCIAGSGDHMMAHAFAGDWDGPCIRRIFGQNHAHHGHFVEWAESVYGQVRAAVSFVPGVIAHLWHGDTANRRYVDRNRDLALFRFDPRVDVAVGPSGCWEWNNDKPGLHQWANDYFSVRQEDGDVETELLSGAAAGLETAVP